MRVGDQIGSYRVEGTLGQGGMGSVYLARGPRGGQVAIKVLHQVDPELLARFEREARVLQAVSALGVVRVLELGLHEGRPFLVQEYCTGGDLAGHLRKRGRLDPEEARELIREIADSLEVVHQAGIVHRDLKPANVLLAEGRPKVTDFGLARARGIDATSLTETGVMMGTPAYMAPEQLQDARAVDARTDVYALGVMLYELLSARRPFKGATALAVAGAVLEGRPPPLEADVPRGLQAVVARAMQLDPAERYPSAEAMAQALADLTHEEPRSRRLWPLALLGLAALALSAALLGPTLVGQPSPAPSPSAETSPAPPAPASPTSPAPVASPGPSQESTPDASPQPLTPGQAYAQALQLCGPDPASAERALEALADAGHASAQVALLRLLLLSREEKTRAKARKLLRTTPQSPQLTLLRGRLDPDSPAATYAHDALQTLLRLALAAEGPAREVFDLAAVDAGLARSLAALQVKTKESGVSPLFRALLGRRPAWASDWLLAYRRCAAYSRVRAALLDEVRAIPHPGRRRFLLARLQLDHPVDSYAFRPEEDPRRLLQEAAEEGYIPAAAELGRGLLSGSLEGDPDAARRWLTLSAYGGVADSVGLLLRTETPAALIELGAILRNGKALFAKGKWINDKTQNSKLAIALWRLASAQGNPNASRALGDALRDSDPSVARTFHRDAARSGKLGCLEGLLGSIMSSGDEADVFALTVGLAWAGSAAAAVALARSLERRGLPQQARSFFRRAYEIYPKGSPARETVAAALRRLAPPPGGPLEEAGHFELLSLLKRGEAEAVKEFGRRASLEGQGETRLQRLRNAASLGEAQCLIDLAHALRLREPLGVRPLFSRAVKLGRSDALASLGKNAELRSRAAAGDPWASYGWGLVLLHQGRPDEALAALKPTLEHKLPPIHRLALEVEFARIRKGRRRASSELLELALERPAVLGTALFYGAAVPKDHARARELLLQAAIRSDVQARDLVLMGRVVEIMNRTLGPALAQPWYQSAANLGNPEGALKRVRFLLSSAHGSEDWDEGWSQGQTLVKSLGEGAPKEARLTLAGAALYLGPAERQQALAAVAKVTGRHDSAARLARIKLHLSLGQREQALALFAQADSEGSLVPLNLFRRAEGILIGASEGQTQEEVEALVASDEANARLLLCHHVLGDLILGVEHPGEPTIDECLEDSLLRKPHFRRKMQELKAIRQRLR